MKTISKEEIASLVDEYIKPFKHQFRLGEDDTLKEDLMNFADILLGRLQQPPQSEVMTLEDDRFTDNMITPDLELLSEEVKKSRINISEIFKIIDKLSIQYDENAQSDPKMSYTIKIQRVEDTLRGTFELNKVIIGQFKAKSEQLQAELEQVKACLSDLKDKMILYSETESDYKCLDNAKKLLK